jgi:hypothetical protein
MSYTERFSEHAELLGTIYGTGAGETNTGYKSLGNFARAVVIIHPVSLGGNALDVDIEQAKTTGGAGAKSFDSGSKDIAVASTDTKPSVIEIRAEELDIDGKFDCINVEITPAGAAYYVAELWGLEARHKPVSTTNLDSVTD